MGKESDLPAEVSFCKDERSAGLSGDPLRLWFKIHDKPTCVKLSLCVTRQSAAAGTWERQVQGLEMCTRKRLRAPKFGYQGTQHSKTPAGSGVQDQVEPFRTFWVCLTF